MNNNMNNNVGTKVPLLCAKGCGFFGNPDTRGLCSVCYRDYLKNIALNTKKEVEKPLNNVEESVEPSVVSNNDDPKSVTNNAKKKTPNRCDECKKRVGFTGFECRCGGLFCGSHRLPEEHSCGFDHKGLHRENLSKMLYAGACKAKKLDYTI